MLGEFFALLRTEFVSMLWPVIWDSLPVLLPLLLASIWFSMYIDYKRRTWIKEQGSIVLEIKLPRVTTKSPAAMELALYGFWEDIVGTLFDVYLSGRVRDWHSLEIASIGGQVKFFVWTLPKWKKVIETRLYAQFPDIEVHEVPDYTRGVQYDPGKMNMFAVHTALTKPDVYPIRTYIDYGLDKPGTENEEKVDPLVPLLEFLGSLGPHEQCWIQIMIQAHRKEKILQDVTLSPRKNFRDEKEVNKVIKEIVGKARFKPEEGQVSSFHLSTEQMEAIKAIERSQDKHTYETMIRMIYFADKEHYNSMGGLGLIGSMRQFGSRNLNGIKPVFQRPENAYPWQDFRGIRKHSYRRKMLEAYKRRSAFNGPFKNWQAKPYILTVEELATLFHFPSVETASTPTLRRIPSKRAEAPANLPV